MAGSQLTRCVRSARVKTYRSLGVHQARVLRCPGEDVTLSGVDPNYSARCVRTLSAASKKRLDFHSSEYRLWRLTWRVRVEAQVIIVPLTRKNSLPPNLSSSSSSSSASSSFSTSSSSSSSSLTPQYTS